jgi:hypothetical protein
MEEIPQSPKMEEIPQSPKMEEIPQSPKMEEIPITTSLIAPETQSFQHLTSSASPDNEAETLSRHPDKTVETKTSMKRYKKKKN